MNFECSVAQSHLTLSDPMDCSLPGSSVHRISQARILEWAAIYYSSGSSQLEIKPVSSAVIDGFFITEPPGKPKLIY